MDVSIWDVVVAWVGWYILAPLAFFVALFLGYLLVSLIGEALSALKRALRK